MIYYQGRKLMLHLTETHLGLPSYIRSAGQGYSHCIFQCLFPLGAGLGQLACALRVAAGSGFL